MKLRCLIGHISYGGDMYATNDIFDIDNDVVAKSLISDGDAEEVIDDVQPSDVKPDTNKDVDMTSTEAPTSTKNTHKKVVNKR